MGKVIAPLAEGKLPVHTIFDRRFVVECCERFHIHWRNLRLELTAESWTEFVETFETAIATWRTNGSPREHPHLELAKSLMDVSQIVHPTGVEVELCENLYKSMRATHGADADFWDEDAFVHFHYRDLRFEMSIEDFLGFSSTIATARERLRTMLYKPVAQLFEQLNDHNILYVVLRNWELLPDSVAVGPHSDLDLLVHPAHVARLDELWNAQPTQAEPYRVQRRVPVLGPGGEQSFLLTDVRTTDDGYMPEGFSHLLLARRTPHRMFHVLPAREHFLALLYHVVVHKGVMSDDYARRLAGLAEAAGIAFPSTRVNDLGHHLALLRDHGVEPTDPRDLSVLPKLPFVEAPETAISSRLLDIHEGRAYHSRVHLLDGVVRKQTSFDLAEREHVLLSRLSGPRFPRALATSRGAGWTISDIELVDGYPLSQPRPVEEMTLAGMRELVRGCLSILAELDAAQIVHRDITDANILVRNGQPVLIDFGWAVAPDLPHATPAGLGNAGRPADGFCDTYAMGAALLASCASFPELLPVLEAMTRPDRADRITDTASLFALLDAAPSSEAIDRARASLAHRFVPAEAEIAESSRETVVAPVKVLAFAAELLESPELLAAYTEAFAEGEPVQLVAYAPDADPAVIAPLLQAALPAEADVVLVPVTRDTDSERSLAAVCRVLLSGEAAQAPFAELPRVAGEADRLRAIVFPEAAEPPLVSIVIPVFNRLDLTRQCLEAIDSFTSDPSYEIIVVDNASTDGTREFLRAEQAAGALRCVINATNAGFGGACTQGAKRARGEYVLLLNNDTIPEPGWLSALVEAMADPAVGIAGGRLLYPDRTIQHAGIAWNDQGRPVHVHRGVAANAAAVLEQRDFGAVTGACLLIRKDLFFEIGGFDDGYHMYVEDVDLCLRVWAADRRVTYCPASVVVHLENASVTDVEWRDRNVIAGWQRLNERWAGRWPQQVRQLAWPVTLPGGPRHLAVLSLADDVLEHPELVAEWSRLFADQREATLVIFGAGHDATTLGERLRVLFAQIGVDEDAGPDVLVLAAPAGTSPDPKLLAAVSAVLASEPLEGPLGGLPRVDETGIEGLREIVSGGAAVAA